MVWSLLKNIDNNVMIGLISYWVLRGLFDYVNILDMFIVMVK